MKNRYPLAPIDAEGNTLKVGDHVFVFNIPIHLTHDMPEESKSIIESCRGTRKKIYEIDEYGFMGLEKIVVQTADEYVVEKFAIEPEFLRASR